MPVLRFKTYSGLLVLTLLLVLTGGALLSLGLQGFQADSNAAAAFDSYLWNITRFTLLQAILSALLSIVFALPVARALHASTGFRGRTLLLRFFAIPLTLPSLVAVFGLTSIYGRNGIIAQGSTALGIPLIPDIYGLTGILLAHVFFNMPLAVRLLLASLESIPQDYWKLSAQLGMGSFARFRLIEWPVIARNLSGIAGLIFMLCASSFTIVLTLGGGPRATTLEVAIYQALHFDFDLGRAVALTLTQLLLTIAVLCLLRLTGKPAEEGLSLTTTSRNYIRHGKPAQILSGLMIIIATLFIALPIFGMIFSGLTSDLRRLLSETAVQQAIITSLLLAFGAATLCVLLSLTLVTAREYSAAQNLKHPRALRSLFTTALDSGASLVLIIPPIVLGAGWFILLRRFTDVFTLAPFMVIAVNGVMAMPFTVRLLRPAWDSAAAQNNRLCTALGITGLNRLRLIDWPVLRRPLALSFMFAMALSMGDLGTIALFGSDAVQTLPYLLLQRMGSYRTTDAAGLALILAVICFALMLATGKKTNSDKTAGRNIL
ncbi:thiamine/thiamine pyrophosphate ABC transporter permease [Pseudochrobactrum sp. sp1633]|uniref:thiamine/thiamine pyrophosphate ABC transporter permease n=1 Tax=Pseudochrobactrum sp. sp1633 TaxID=3036706 RepID=UPI0025A5230D|nr:thiamine/thiamine pyrophosphate ABC transporter permease [Pseudochrobactrum sp. sp1633]MDM8345740.1 thiamine/thiamine pyrophosphate ABC transporter permease [Pseudochrobactrum sp. sp1633]HWD12444.1 thiamine/thiamine pyrophosphate ABC transporter permease [Pseudochrobactrum sp.]